MLLAPDRRVLVQHVVEVADVGDRDPVASTAASTRFGAHVVERLAEIERVGDRIEHRLGRDVGERRVQRRGQLDAIGVEGLAKSSHSSTARSGSGSRRSRGVSSWRAAVSTPTGMDWARTLLAQVMVTFRF